MLLGIRPLEADRPIGLNLFESTPRSAPLSLPARYAYQPKENIFLGMLMASGIHFAFSVYLLIDDPMKNFLAVIGVLGLGPFLLISLLGLLRYAAGPRELELRQDAILLPYGLLGGKTRAVPFSEILAVKVGTTVETGHKTLDLLTHDGRRYLVSSDLLPSPYVFEDVSTFVKSRVGDRTP